MNRSRRLGILGGMFDPIHVGHLDTASAAERVLHLTDILLIPARIPPHRPQPLASSYHRFAMVSMALTGRRGWRASDLELSRPTPSYTADTLRYFLSLGYFPTELVFITGADAFLEIATWKEYPALLDLAHFAVVTRPGVRLDEVPSRLPALRLHAGGRRLARSAAGTPEDGGGQPAAYQAGREGWRRGRRTRHERRPHVDFSDRGGDCRRLIHCRPRGMPAPPQHRRHAARVRPATH